MNSKEETTRKFIKHLEIIRNKGITIAAISRELDVPRSKIANIVAGSSSANKELLQKLFIHYSDSIELNKNDDDLDVMEEPMPFYGNLSEKNIIQLQQRLIEVQGELFRTKESSQEKIEFLQKQLAEMFKLVYEAGDAELVDKLTRGMDIELETKLLNHVAEGLKRDIVNKLNKD